RGLPQAAGRRPEPRAATGTASALPRLSLSPSPTGTPGPLHAGSYRGRYHRPAAAPVAGLVYVLLVVVAASVGAAVAPLGRAPPAGHRCMAVAPQAYGRGPRHAPPATEP